MKIGENSSEGRRRIMHDEQPRMSWENDLKYQMEQFIDPLIPLQQLSYHHIKEKAVNRP
jgi:hypothetical protein